jgi:hypothetical protein
MQKITRVIVIFIVILLIVDSMSVLLWSDPLLKTTSLLHKDQPMELADEIEHLKATILEKMDEEAALRARLREEFVPMTVCTHLEQCIKETEVLV